MLTRDELLRLLDITSDDLKNRNRRLQVPFETENRGRNEYSPAEALAFLLIDDLTSEATSLSGEPAKLHPADGLHLSRSAAASAVRASLMKIGKTLPAIVESGEALVRGEDADEIFIEVIWLSGLAGRVVLAGTLKEISEERIQAAETHRAFPVRGVLMNATRVCAQLLNRASRAGIKITWPA